MGVGSAGVSANNKDKSVAVANLTFQEKDCESHDHIRQKSNTSDESFKHFPQELILVILSLIPLKCLLNNARYVSKSWATTIQSCLHLKPPGVYIENMINSEGSYFLNIQEGLQFEKIYLGIPSKMGKIMATCDGILVLRDYFNERLTFAVNPILKCFFRIPPVPPKERTIQYQSTIACVPGTTKFKLFLVDVLNVSGVNYYVFYVLRIGVDSTWKEIARKEAILRKTYFLWEPVCRGNDIYWITTNEVIVMDVDQETIIREYPLPPLRNNYCSSTNYLWMGDCLSCFEVINNLRYRVYTLNLDLRSWALSLVMGPFDYAATGDNNELDFDNLWSDVYFRFWIDDKIIFKVVFWPINLETRISGMKRGHFCYNVKTKQLTKIEGIAMDQYRAWLHTNTLVSLPSNLT